MARNISAQKKSYTHISRTTSESHGNKSYILVAAPLRDQSNGKESHVVPVGLQFYVSRNCPDALTVGKELFFNKIYFLKFDLRKLREESSWHSNTYDQNDIQRINMTHIFTFQHQDKSR